MKMFIKEKLLIKVIFRGSVGHGQIFNKTVVSFCLMRILKGLRHNKIIFICEKQRVDNKEYSLYI